MPLLGDSGWRPQGRLGPPPGGIYGRYDDDRDDDRDDRPFLKRHFWPPSLLGGLVIGLGVALFVGFLGAGIYTSSEQGRIDAEDDRAVTAPTLPPLVTATAPTTTTLAELSPEEIKGRMAPSVWTIATLDDAGRPIEGSAFVAGSSSGETFLLSSLSLVRSATRVPAPAITASNRGTSLEATLFTWHEERDLALLTIPRTVPSLVWAGDAGVLRPEQKVYAAAAGGVAAGVIVSSAPGVIGHNIFTDGIREGAPLLNARAEVIGVLSSRYDPTNTATDRLFYAVAVSSACERVLRCGAPPTPTTEPTSRSATTTTKVP